MTRYNFLLGATKDNEIVFGEFEITIRNGYPEFTASFYTVDPFNADKIDLEKCCEDYLDGCDKEYLYNLCENFGCSPQKLAKKYADYYGITDIKDCSLYSECYTIDGDEWYFESISCGQHDTRNEMEEYTDKDAYDSLIALWDTCHLKEIDNTVVQLVEDLASALDKVNEEEWIVDYIKRHMDELA